MELKDKRWVASTTSYSKVVNKCVAILIAKKQWAVARARIIHRHMSRKNHLKRRVGQHNPWPMGDL